MQELINVIVNNGIGVVCVAYLMYFQMTTMKEIQNTLWEFNLHMKDITNILAIVKQELQELKEEKKK